MAIAKVRVNAPLHFSAGEVLNGATLVAPGWVRSGVIEMDHERAASEARNGYVSIVEIDGQASGVGCCAKD